MCMDMGTIENVPINYFDCSQRESYQNEDNSSKCSPIKYAFLRSKLNWIFCKYKL